MELQGHAWELLKAGPLEVEVRIGPPVSLDSFADRKELARHTEGEVRANVIRRLRQRPPHERLEVVVPRQAPQEGRHAAAMRERPTKWV